MDLFHLLGKISINNSEANKALDETSEAGQQAESKLGKAFKAVGNGALAVGKTIATGMAAGATAVGALVTKSVQSYANYEQLVGGIDTLFKDSSAKVQEYAANAYNTAGLSANEYMETVTSFSASLLQGLDGDTSKAAEIANRAITDMSDNANKMGTDMTMIQNAYQGFAKQNYTMLDNLKLGYGGTQAEMARLINDSGVLGDSMEVTAETVNEVSFDKIIEAISVVQDRLGFTGTTAKEAAGTISGSMASVKSAWKNLLTAVASDELPFEDYMNRFIESASTMAENMLPRIEIALGGVVQLIEGMAPIIINAIPSLLDSILPTITSAAQSLLQAVVSAIPGAISAISAAIPGLLGSFLQIFEQITGMIPSLMDQLFLLLVESAPILIDGISQAFLQLIEIIPDLLQSIYDHLPEFCRSFVSSLKKNLPVLIKGVTSVILEIAKFLPEAAKILADVIPILVESLCSTLLENLPILIDSILLVAQALFDATDQIIEILIPMIPVILESLVSALIEALPMIIEGCCLLLEMIAENAPTIILGLLEALPGIIGMILSAIWDLLPVILESCGTLLGAIWDFIWQFLGNLLEPVGQFFSDMWNSAVTALQKAWDWCVNLLSGVGQWIYNTVIAPVVKFFTDLWNDIVNAYHTVIDPWIEIVKRISKIIYDSVIKPIFDYFKNLWSDIKGVFSAVKGWFNQYVVQPVTGFFKNMWSGLKNGASDAWKGVTNIFGKVKDWFQEKFSAAWNAVKGVFSTGGKVFDGIKEGIASVFTTTVNAIIRGINKVVKLPFQGLNSVLDKISGIEIVGVKPFDWLTWRAPIPEIPELAEGGVLERGQVGLLEGDGAEAVVPLEKNTGWLNKVAQQIHEFSLESKNDLSMALSTRAVDLQQQQLSETQKLNEKIDAIISMLAQFFPEALEAMQTPMVLDPDGAAVAMAPAMDAELGKIAIMKGRGR